MSESLRDLLLKSGLPAKLKAEAKTTVKPARDKKPFKISEKPKNQIAAEPDLAQAYAMRARQERAEREQTQRKAAELARLKRERKEKLSKLLQGKALNNPEADIPRHFPHGDKIRRCYCTQDQFDKLNRGELGLVQLAGRYLLVERSVALEAQTIMPTALVLLCDPNASEEEDIPAF